ncbi:hypothetical protein [Brevundimonas sp.]|uniref:hypothetical protein n=1 Tax=Brevundimonas sp. TaxID=1871086 RepID=UPI0028B042BE|nr:hypothetical protein [Brevundimonas sp.]
MTTPTEVLEAGAELKSPAEFDQWRKAGGYLPDFMRDFHDQKDLFKAMQDVVERSNAKHGGHRSLNATWTDYHIYTVDIFLWVLAAHGYTLQRSRHRFGFASVYDFVASAKERAREAMASVFASRRGGEA